MLPKFRVKAMLLFWSILESISICKAGYDKGYENSN